MAHKYIISYTQTINYTLNNENIFHLIIINIYIHIPTHIPIYTHMNIHIYNNNKGIVNSNKSTNQTLQTIIKCAWKETMWIENIIKNYKYIHTHI